MGYEQKYIDFMRGLGERIYSSIVNNDPHGLFAVLDSLKEHVEQDGFENIDDIESFGNLLTKYPHTKLEGLSLDIEPARADYLLMRKHYPLGTTLDVIANEKISDRLNEVILEMDLMLVRDDYYRDRRPYNQFVETFYPRKDMLDGNKYRVWLRAYANSEAKLSVFHKSAIGLSEKILAEMKTQIKGMVIELDAEVEAHLAKLEVEIGGK